MGGAINKGWGEAIHEGVGGAIHEGVGEAFHERVEEPSMRGWKEEVFTIPCILDTYNP